MKRLFSAVSAAFLLLAGASQASAATITEEFSVFYTNTTSTAFSLTNTFFGLAGGTNLITGATNFSSLAGGSSGTLLSEQVVLDTTQSYTFSGAVNGSVFSRAINVGDSVGVVNFSNSGFIVVAESMSAVPLPASFPLFALALICLGAWGFYERKKKQAPSQDAAPSASFQPA
jgi:hypothetical protein